jgi:hypothetical protein
MLRYVSVFDGGNAPLAAKKCMRLVRAAMIIVQILLCCDAVWLGRNSHKSAAVKVVR